MWNIVVAVNEEERTQVVVFWKVQSSGGLVKLGEWGFPNNREINFQMRYTDQAERCHDPNLLLFTTIHRAQGITRSNQWNDRLISSEHGTEELQFPCFSLAPVLWSMFVGFCIKIKGTWQIQETNTSNSRWKKCRLSWRQYAKSNLHSSYI